jgi:NAD(P)-dependent dehydrogenase (short-subunit alcohol dehydrogenase family)
MRLDGKVAVVTGGSSGIGLAIAKLFSAEGARIAIMGRGQAALDEAAQAVGGSCLAVQGDVTSLSDLDRLYAATQGEFGSGIDVLVANAGVGKLVALEEMDEETFDWTSDINFKGVYFTVQRAMPHLNDGGSVVLMGSSVHRLGVAGYSAYCATKAAVRSMARTFSAELLPRGVRVNSLGVGGTETPFFSKVGLSADEMAEFGKMMAERIPAHRFAQPEEIAKAALYLASDDSVFMAGSELTIDGGHAEI